MKKLIGIGMLIVMFLLGVIASRAQSTDVEDYSPVFTTGNVTYYVDTTSIQRLSGNRVVFWSLFMYKPEVAALASIEINCLIARARVRDVRLVSPEWNKNLKQTTAWLPRTNVVANRYIFLACK
jgi:hypothetical protein